MEGIGGYARVSTSVDFRIVSCCVAVAFEFVTSEGSWSR
jgi:hypothetical protein